MTFECSLKSGTRLSAIQLSTSLWMLINVYFYGIKSGQLYVFDAEMDELDCLGPIESALETVLDELVTSRQDVGDC